MCKDNSLILYEHHIKIFVYITVILFSLLLITLKISYAESESVVEVSGIIEVEAQYYRRKFDDPNKKKENVDDISLATVEVGIDAKIHPLVKGHVLLLWEEEETEEVQDFLCEGTITIANPDKLPYYFTAGKMYLPFGSFETSFINDPMTLELGEINETAFMAGFIKENSSMSFGFFNGDIEKSGKDDEINSFFAQIEINYSDSPFSLSTSASYLSNIADSDGLQYTINELGDSDEAENKVLNNYVQGIGMFIRADTAKAFLLAEYLGAIENFKEDFFEKSIRPEAYNIELGMKFSPKGYLAFKFEKSNDMAVNEDFNFPEKRYGVVISYSIFEAASLSLEYIHEKYTLFDKGKNNILTTQLAIEF